MFRELIRKKQAMTNEECIEVLKTETRGVLCMSGDDDYPYGLPMNFWYDEETGHIYFHGSKRGHKIDSITRNDKVSFCVYDKGYRLEGEWPYHVKSVIIFGRIRRVEDPKKVETFLRNLCAKFTDDKEYAEKEIAAAATRVQCLEIVPEHMTGKHVTEN